MLIDIVRNIYRRGFGNFPVESSIELALLLLREQQDVLLRELILILGTLRPLEVEIFRTRIGLLERECSLDIGTCRNLVYRQRPNPVCRPS